MAKIIIGIGLPGSGKTTALKPFAEKYSYTYICPDDIRAELLGNASDQSKNKEIWQEAHKRVAEALSNGETVIFDATFARDFERKSFIQFAREHGASKVQGVFAEVPLEIASERNHTRERVVPDHAMERMSAMLRQTPPVVEDGFDSIFYINELQELQRVEMKGEQSIQTHEFKTKLR